MAQFRLEQQKKAISLLMVLLAVSSLGFAVLGLLRGPEIPYDLKPDHQVELEIARPEMPDLQRWEDFWQDSGYFILTREQNFQAQTGTAGSNLAWIQGQETLVLVPERHDLRLARAILQLSELFLEEGWVIQLEASDHGYKMGFWSHLFELEQRVLAYEWTVEVLNPRNYDKYYGGMISVMGQSFDPEGFMRRTPQSPVLALLIDDWGYAGSAVEAMMAYPLPLTMAVLPHLGLSQEASQRLDRAGHEVILHQPMEATNSSLDIGPGGITLGMDGAAVEAQLKENLASLPVAVGVNNHMGSLVTGDHETMGHVLKVVQELGLFFVDSRTTTASVVQEVALELGVPYGVNNFFMDNESDVDKIKGQLRAGLELAQSQGHAVIIGHVRPATAVALWEMLPEFLNSGVHLVPVSRVLFNE